MVCQYGQGLVQGIFEEFDARSLKGIAVWIPVMNGDSPGAACTEAENLSDDRIEHAWDAEQRLGELFAKMLGLQGVAWDVYLLYEPGVEWGTNGPPVPSFWMHQLPTVVGADSDLLLNAERFSREVLQRLDAEHLEVGGDLALRLHAKGLSAAKRQRA